MDPKPKMVTLPEKRAEWLYAHFQGITQKSERLLVLFGTFLVSATAAWRSSSGNIELPILKVDVGREALIGWLAVLALFVLVAFFGNFDKGELTISELAAELRVGYEALWFIDTNPTVIDFAQFRRPTVAAKRGRVSRAVAALLYPIVLGSALIWLLAITAREAFVGPKSLFDAAPFVIAIPLAVVAVVRAFEYITRRWVTWLSSEQNRKRASGTDAGATDEGL